ncbi:hypothetical protein LCGC14_1065100 [marine sediment metagenome]|uniref:Sialidase domain-containing protein n=1 Tax=marine sediment metagenome TaxID=412755 RepID=A0A0F9MJW4_9ZZZZ
MANVTINGAAFQTLFARSSEHGIVWTTPDVGYAIHLDSDRNVLYQKTADAGVTWGSEIQIDAGTTNAFIAVWYDKWTSEASGTEIHVAYHDGNNVSYRGLDTSDDSLSTQTTVFSGTSASAANLNDGQTAIVKSRGGNLYVASHIDGGGEIDFSRSTDGGANWTSRTDVYDGNQDRVILTPGSEADNQDIWGFYKDISANELSIKVYDNSGNSWAETAIESYVAEDDEFLMMGASHRQSDNHTILCSINDFDTATADLNVWDVASAASITAKTVVLANAAEMVDCRMLINQQNDDLYCVYSRGGTLFSSMTLRYKLSDDGGDTWGTETSLSQSADDFRWLSASHSIGDDGGRVSPIWFNDDLNDVLVNNSLSVEIAAAGAVSIAVLRRRYEGY